MRSSKLFVATLAGLSLWSQSFPPQVSQSEHADLSDPLYLIALRTPRQFPVAMRLGNHHAPIVHDNGLGVSFIRTPEVESTVIDRLPPAAPSIALGTSFEGLGAGFPAYAISTAPPDTVMAVGPDHIFQWVNTDYAIFDKAGVPLLPSPGFLPGNSLWSGFGGPCETTNQGDPIVQYDKAAGRWIAMQFAFTSLVRGPFYQCVAVSATGNPLGAYYRYSFAYAFFPDYPKLGIWPSAYFVGYNFFGAVLPKGGGACALDRAAMLAGAPTAAQVCFGPSGAPMNNFPVDWDGATPPPSGAAGYFAVSNQFNAIHLYRFQINFANPAAATFNDGFGGPDLSFVTLSTPIPRSCRTCIPQPGTTQALDTLGDRLMFRSVYQNLDGSERLLITHAVDPDGPGPKVAGVRLYEIASPGSASPAFVNNVTYSPDAAERWMSSAAMDKRGNIAVGYNVSSTTVSPGLRLTGRRATDPPNTLQAESVVVNGAGSQINGLSRWGDYSAMQLDPADGCTFWFTGEYMGATGIFNWQTRIASARFPGCL